MEITVAVLLAALLFFGVLITCGALLGRGPSDLVTLFVLVVALFYGFRPFLFVLGLDGPYPGDLFFPAQMPELLVTTLLGLTLFLACATLGIAAAGHFGGRGWGPFFARHETDVRRALRVTFALTAVGTAVSVYLVARYGGIGGVIVASKYDKVLEGLFILRSISAVAAIVSVTTFIDARRQGGWPTWVRVLLLVCAVANALYVFMWGTRSVLVVVAATLVLGLQSRRRPNTHRGRQRVWVRLLLAAALVLVAASGARMVRDTLSHGEVQANYAASSMWRQASVGTNSVYFDATMLSFRDWPSEQRFRRGEDFRNGVVGLVPRRLWSGKPEAIPPGRWFRQVYEPRKLNGWPMGAGGLWYLNFGWPGLLLGGLFSGLVVGLVAAAQRRRPASGFNSGVAIVTAVFVLPLGWDNQVLMKAVIWLVPLWLVSLYVAPRPRPDPTGCEGPPGGVGRGDAHLVDRPADGSVGGVAPAHGGSGR